MTAPAAVWQCKSPDGALSELYALTELQQLVARGGQQPDVERLLVRSPAVACTAPASGQQNFTALSE